MKTNYPGPGFGVRCALFMSALSALAILPAILPASRASSAMDAQERGGRTKTTPTPTPKPATPRQSEANPRRPKPSRPTGPHAEIMPPSGGAWIRLIWVPPGTFTMGSDTGEPAEKPAHRVTISEGFYIGHYEVTQAEWQAVMGNNPSNFKDCGGNCPVEQVSWDDAQKFIQRLNQTNDGYVYRLPTEAEWEYACRAGTTGDYAGNLSEMAWYADNSGNRTNPVGQKRPNAFGLYDMHGDVWEWCEDWYHETYAGAPTDGSAWLSGGKHEYRVLRGGSWGRNAALLRSALRSWGPQNHSSNHLGLRVVAVLRTQ
ncbi:MAG: formylglycine-generating enzyme family protein [Pyrinomonadaceae bacterium]